MRVGLPILGITGLLILFSMFINQGTAMAQEEQEENVYNVDIQPLSIEECARCHNSHFKRIRDNGDKHTKVTCTDCHELFHTYNPLKGNYADIMPKCSSCHGSTEQPFTLPAPKYHTDGEILKNCLGCHTDPHQPIATLPEASNLESMQLAKLPEGSKAIPSNNCRKCHGDIAALLTDKLSKHTDEDCSSCHSDNHGRIPDCSECHESHSPAVALNNPACMSCHPVHTPLVIAYPQDQDNTVCAGCHGDVYDELQANPTKHTPLSCAKCHPAHAELMACSECHSASPHNPSIHQKFPECGSCHNIAHDLHM